MDGEITAGSARSKCLVAQLCRQNTQYDKPDGILYGEPLKDILRSKAENIKLWSSIFDRIDATISLIVGTGELPEQAENLTNVWPFPGRATQCPMNHQEVWQAHFQIEAHQLVSKFFNNFLLRVIIPSNLWILDYGPHILVVMRFNQATNCPQSEIIQHWENDDQWVREKGVGCMIRLTRLLIDQPLFEDDDLTSLISPIEPRPEEPYDVLGPSSGASP